MGIAAWGWDRNWIRQGTLMASSQVAGLGVENLKGVHGSPSMGWQTAGTSAILDINMGQDVPWQAFLLARTNLTAAATIRWRTWDAADVRLYTSGYINAGVEPGIGQSLLLLQGGTTGVRAQCEIADPTNPDGFLNIPLAYAGPVDQTQLNIGWGGGLGRVQGGAETRTRGGAVFDRLDWTARTRDIEHNSIVDEEVWPFVMALDLFARRGGNVLLIPDPDSPDRSRETIFGRLKTSGLLTFPNESDERCAWRATIEERL